MIMQIGELNKRITLQYETKTSDSMGGYDTTWTDDLTVWAAIWPRSAKEIRRNEHPTMEISHQIRIWYHSTITTRWRIKYGTRYFNIISIINPDEKNSYLDILAQEVT